MRSQIVDHWHTWEEQHINTKLQVIRQNRRIQRPMGFVNGMKSTKRYFLPAAVFLSNILPASLVYLIPFIIFLLHCVPCLVNSSRSFQRLGQSKALKFPGKMSTAKSAEVNMVVQDLNKELSSTACCELLIKNSRCSGSGCYSG